MLSQKMIELSSKVEKINSLTGIIMLVKIVSNSVLISGSTCALAVGELDLTSKVALIGFAVTSLIDITIGCRSSQLVINAMNNLCKIIENMLSIKSFNEDDYRQLKLIVSLKEYFKYNVLDLFDLKDVTILLTISYITNYAVILIQTQ